ncbi:Protein of unknown function, partial [Gryllus bimaculatus]
PHEAGQPAGEQAQPQLQERDCSTERSKRRFVDVCTSVMRKLQAPQGRSDMQQEAVSARARRASEAERSGDAGAPSVEMEKLMKAMLSVASSLVHKEAEKRSL